jgi:hypothetical protein
MAGNATSTGPMSKDAVTSNGKFPLPKTSNSLRDNWSNGVQDKQGTIKGLRYKSEEGGSNVQSAIMGMKFKA